jgi:hypothetical protein
LKTDVSEAYRRGMFRLNTPELPNTALHWTPAAAPPSPVSFQTFGDRLGNREVGSGVAS